MSENQLYRCRECGWTGMEIEMFADAMATGEDEIWSNWICGHCHNWFSLSDYDKVDVRSDIVTVPYEGV